MTNGEKYKDAESRINALNEWCKRRDCFKCELRNACKHSLSGRAFYWLEQQCEVEEPLPCPFCGTQCEVVYGFHGYYLRCRNSNNCAYRSNGIRFDDCGFTGENERNAKIEETEQRAIEAHNRVCREGGMKKEAMK